VLTIALEAEKLPAGVSRSLDLAVQSKATEHLLLESVRLEPGRASFAEGDALSWRRHPEGVVAYDISTDTYVHQSEVLGVSAVPLHHGVLPPGARAEALLPTRLARSGRVALTLSYRVLPALEGRVYSAPEGMSKAKVVFSPGYVPGPAIVRAEDLPLRTERLELELSVEGELPAGMVARSRTLGWIGEGFTLGGKRVPPDVIDALDRLVIDEPVGLLFRGPAAERVRSALSVSVNPARQGAIEADQFQDLLAACEREGARLSVGLPWEGIVVA